MLRVWVSRQEHNFPVRLLPKMPTSVDANHLMLVNFERTEATVISAKIQAFPVGLGPGISAMVDKLSTAMHVGTMADNPIEGTRGQLGELGVCACVRASSQYHA